MSFLPHIKEHKHAKGRLLSCFRFVFAGGSSPLPKSEGFGEGWGGVSEAPRKRRWGSGRAGVGSVRCPQGGGGQLQFSVGSETHAKRDRSEQLAYFDISHFSITFSRFVDSVVPTWHPINYLCYQARIRSFQLSHYMDRDVLRQLLCAQLYPTGSILPEIQAFSEQMIAVGLLEPMFSHSIKTMFVPFQS